MTQAPPPKVPASLALRVIAEMDLQEHDLLARELNTYLSAIRTRAGRTEITAAESQTLFYRMYDVAKITPTQHPVDLDNLETEVAKPDAQLTKLVPKRRLD